MNYLKVNYVLEVMKKKVRKELIEWIILLSVIGIIYFGGWHTEVVGRIQQVVLTTGILSPNEVEETKIASYNYLLEDLEGKQISFTEFEGDVVFVNFWATWCPPCIAEMPDIQSLYEKQKEGVRFAMISLDQDETKAKEFISRKGFDFPVYFLRSRLPDSYDTHSIPTTYVMDKKGYVKIENHGMAKYNTSKFNQLLDGLSKPK